MYVSSSVWERCVFSSLVVCRHKLSAAVAAVCLSACLHTRLPCHRVPPLLSYHVRTVISCEQSDDILSVKGTWISRRLRPLVSIRVYTRYTDVLILWPTGNHRVHGTIKRKKANTDIVLNNGWISTVRICVKLLPSLLWNNTNKANWLMGSVVRFTAWVCIQWSVIDNIIMITVNLVLFDFRCCTITLDSAQRRPVALIQGHCLCHLVVTETQYIKKNK